MPKIGPGVFYMWGRWSVTELFTPKTSTCGSTLGNVGKALTYAKIILYSHCGTPRKRSWMGNHSLKFSSKQADFLFVFHSLCIYKVHVSYFYFYFYFCVICRTSKSSCQDLKQHDIPFCEFVIHSRECHCYCFYYLHPQVHRVTVWHPSF